MERRKGGEENEAKTKKKFIMNRKDEKDISTSGSGSPLSTRMERNGRGRAWKGVDDCGYPYARSFKGQTGARSRTP